MANAAPDLSNGFGADLFYHLRGECRPNRLSPEIVKANQDVHICKMRIRLPISELIRYSISLSVAITVFFFIMIYLQDLDIVAGLYRSVVSGAVLLSTSVVSIALIVLFEKRTSTGSMQRTRTRCVLGNLINTLLLLSYQFLRGVAEKYGLFPSELYDFREMQALHGWQLYLVIFISSLMIYSLVHLLHNFILLQHLKTQTEIEVSQLRSANAE